MAATHLSGPLYLYGPNGTPDTPMGIVTAAVMLPVVPTANASTDFVLPLPVGARVLRITHYTTVAFTGSTATIQVGSAAGGAQYVAATDVKAAGTVALTITPALVTTAATLAAPLYVRLAQTGATAVGAGSLMVEYY